jgi:hypothetical protein
MSALDHKRTLVRAIGMSAKGQQTSYQPKERLAQLTTSLHG